ncbi:MAG: hypothetical protein ACRC46_10000 [Thermoguttaceae bacterium]
MITTRSIWRAVFAVAIVASFTAMASAATTVSINGKTVLPSNGSANGTWFFHDGDTQLLLLGHSEPTPCYRVVAAMQPGDKICFHDGETILLELHAEDTKKTVDLKTSLPLDPVRRPVGTEPVASSPNFHPALETALVEHDWGMQDGINTPREPKTFAEVIPVLVTRIEKLLANLAENGVQVATFEKRLHDLQTNTDDEQRWLALHRLRREIVFVSPLFPAGPILFAKHVPSAMSHQLTQVYGYAARPGGGLFVLENPGTSMQVRSLTEGKLPAGNFMHPEVSFDGTKIFFAFCDAAKSPSAWRDPDAMNRWYHIYEMNADGTGLRKLTDGEFDDFSPTPLPDGTLMCVSTRRGGFHRCGGGPCYVYTLATLDPKTAPQTPPTPISFHETNEWDPTPLNDGRIVYTRWDYVDRDAVFYQQLWSVRQDGSDVRIYYGNNTFVPCGVWEARAIPNSSKVMATAGPHHGMSAGSIIVLDTTLGVDGDAPITRVTPDARFPEGETLLAMGIPLPTPSDFDSPIASHWDAVNRPDRPANRETVAPEAERRWPGHCYKSPFPLAENAFIVSYSFDTLRGEPGPNIPNMFGIYFADAFGNKELIYRDPNISSVWAKPLAPRTPPMATPPRLVSDHDSDVATFSLHNVYESWPALPRGDDDKITALRIIQVLPKTTPNANDPMVGAAFASPAKQVLGTVPVEDDGSAFFECPPKTPVLFQALDARGRAVQTMRSLTYLQHGEQMSCLGCHENRMQTLNPRATAKALQRPPSKIAAGPDGSKPMSFPILVQPVLDKHCVSCHSENAGNEKNAGVVLTGEPEGAFSRSYNALVPRTAYSAWTMPEGNHEPLTEPNRFGARVSSLVKLLDAGHHDVSLSPDDWERLNTWIDSNALFYGTFNRENQQRQLRGERIAGPDLE